MNPVFDQFDQELPDLSSLQAKQQSQVPLVHICVKDFTTSIFDKVQLFNTVWSAWYAGEFYFNYSPWVEHGYCTPFGGLSFLKQSDPLPPDAWLLELLMNSDQEGALGYHNDRPRTSKTGPSGSHSERGMAIHPVMGTEIPLMKIFCETCRQDNAYITECLTHEEFEALVDPDVENEENIRRYLNPQDGFIYICEVGDPVQDESLLVGEYIDQMLGTKRPSVPEAMLANMAWPKWFGLAQGRDKFDQRGSCTKAFEVRPGGYMSRYPESKPGSWEQIHGSEKAKADHPNPL